MAEVDGVLEQQPRLVLEAVGVRKVYPGTIALYSWGNSSSGFRDLNVSPISATQ